MEPKANEIRWDEIEQQLSQAAQSVDAAPDTPEAEQVKQAFGNLFEELSKLTQSAQALADKIANNE